jgi:peptidoglycan hydrolase-like protein with peptidoglycan-binding domain
VRKGGFPEWREIICGEKMTGYNVRKIQEALKALGYYQGAIDGALNNRTQTAISQFQRDRNLPADGNVDFETLKALGVG